MSRRFRPMPPRPPRKPAHRKPNGPGAGVTFKEIVLENRYFQFEARLTDADKHSVYVNRNLPIKELVMESYYDGVESPHGFDEYASGGEKDAIAGTLVCEFNLWDLLREALNTRDLEAVEEVLNAGGDIIVSGEWRTTEIDDAVYSPGWSRQKLSVGGGPDVFVNAEIGLDVSEVYDDGSQEPICSVNAYDGFDCQLEASEETATLYATLDETIYGVFNDHYGTFPIIGTKSAEENYEEQVASGDYEYVKLCLVDRDGHPYETQKEWHKDDSDRSPNPRRPRLPGRRRR